MSNGKKTTLNVGEATERVGTVVDDLDELRGGALDRLLAARKRKAVMRQRALERRVERRGEADPTVKILAARIEHDAAVIDEIRPLAVAARHQVPERNAKEWRLHGTVAGANNAPLAGATVVLTDSAGRKIRDTPEAVTDAEGYYELRLPLSEALERDVFLQVRESGKSHPVAKHPIEKLEPGAALFRPLRVAARVAVEPIVTPVSPETFEIDVTTTKRPGVVTPLAKAPVLKVPTAGRVAEGGRARKAKKKATRKTKKKRGKK